MTIDPAEAGKLAAAFKANPKGPHSPALQRILNAMRGLPVRGKHILIFDRAAGDYMLGELPGERNAPIRRHTTVRFADPDAGEWYVFRQRFRVLFGIALDE